MIRPGIKSANGFSSPLKLAITAFMMPSVIHLRQVERVPRPLGQQDQKTQLAAAVAFAEPVNGIQFCEQMRSCIGELLRTQPFGAKLVHPTILPPRMGCSVKRRAAYSRLSDK